MKTYKTARAIVLMTVSLLSTVATAASGDTKSQTWDQNHTGSLDVSWGVQKSSTLNFTVTPYDIRDIKLGSFNGLNSASIGTWKSNISYSAHRLSADPVPGDTGDRKYVAAKGDAPNEYMIVRWANKEASDFRTWSYNSDTNKVETYLEPVTGEQGGLTGELWVGNPPEHMLSANSLDAFKSTRFVLNLTVSKAQP